MEYVFEKKMSEDTKDYLISLHLRKTTGREIDFDWVDSVIIEEETRNIFFLLECHLMYPLMIWEYILVYKKERVVLEIESGKSIQERIKSIRIPEILETEKEKVLDTAINMFLQYKKVFILSSDKTREEELNIGTEDIKYYK